MRATARKNILHSIYSLVVTLIGLFLLAVLFEGLDLDKSTDFFVLIIIGILMESFAVDFPLGRLTGIFSLILSSLLIYNLNASVWISSVAFFISSSIISRENSIRTSAFNMSQQVITLYSAVTAAKYIWGFELTSAFLLSNPYSGALYLLFLIALYYIINHILVYFYTLPGREGLRMHSWKDTLRWDAFSYFFTTPFGIVMAILYHLIGLASMVLLVIPVLTVQLILRRYIRTELVNRELRSVYEINKALGVNRSVDEITYILLREMRRAISFHTGVVYLKDPEGKFFNCVCAVGPYKEQLEKDLIIPGEGFLGWVINNGDPEIIFDSRIDPRVKDEQGLPQVYRSLLVIPLVGEIGTLGLVVLGDKKKLSFTEQDLSVALSLCGRVTVSLVNEALYEKLEILKKRDPVTGLLNRRTIYLKGCQSFERLSELGETHIALALLDIDILGHINEGWGQHVGDAMITRLGHLLGSLERNNILIGRFADDEFAILLLGYDEDMALELLSKIKEDLADYQFSDEFPLLRIKFSIGLAVGPEDGTNFDQLLKSAANALAAAKKKGRDQIITATDLRTRWTGRSDWIT